VRTTAIWIAVLLISIGIAGGRETTRYVLIGLSLVGVWIWCRFGYLTGLRTLCIAPVSFCFNVAVLNGALVAGLPPTMPLAIRWVQIVELHGMILTISTALLISGYIGWYFRHSAAQDDDESIRK
jgi:hypothetical protein